MSGRIMVLPPREKTSGNSQWNYTGWPHRADLGVWLRRRRSGTEISTDEVLVRATAPKGVAPAGEVRVFHRVRIWRSRDRAREWAAVVVRTGSWQMRLDVKSAEALATALRMVLGRPCRCDEPQANPPNATDAG